MRMISRSEMSAHQGTNSKRSALRKVDSDQVCKRGSLEVEAAECGGRAESSKVKGPRG